MQFTSAKRADTGTYLLKATNKNGVDEAEIDILVVGPPSIPQGPLMAEDVFADRCNIKYRVPLDDGGSPITHYTVEKLDLTAEAGTWVACGRSTELQCHVEGLEEM